jgi:hypothetical protein
MRVPGCNSYYKFVLGAGAKAKTPDDPALRDVGTGVTNNLPILSVLATGMVNFSRNLIHYFSYCQSRIRWIFE